MAEIFGIATAALGLFPLCRDGFRMVQDVIGASEKSREVSARVQSQINIFEQWRKAWDMDDEWGKFKEYAKKNESGARAIGHELALLSYTLCNASKLLSKYGLRLKDQHRHQRKPDEIPNPDISSLLESESYFRKWVDGYHNNDAEILVDRLRERNEALRQFTPNDINEKQKHNTFYIFGKDASEELVKALFREANRAKKSGQQSLPYQEFGQIAAFSVQVKDQRRQEKEQKHPRHLRRFEPSQFRTSPNYKVSAPQDAEMALLRQFPIKSESRVVYIEWISGEGALERESKAIAKARMLSTTMSEQVLLPTCYGILEDDEGPNKRFGLVLAPPEHIRQSLGMLMPGSISRKRMPKSLRTVLHDAEDREDLGIRFNLAKRLVNAVHKMHCVDWIHKLRILFPLNTNIRPGSIMFFPSSSEVKSTSSDYPRQFDCSKPLLVGFGHARIDENQPANGYCYVPGQITLDEYQHPQKMENPSTKYSRFFDIYSIGCVLLEIGMWQPLSKLVDIPTHRVQAEKTRKDMQKKAECLIGITGSVYAGVVKKCLGVDPDSRLSEEENNDACATLLSELISELDKCSA